MKGDLHIHTDISDGSYTIDELLKEAKEKKLTHIAITNHDTVDGLEEAIRKGKEIGIKVIPGIEISAYDLKNKRKIHILGYNFNLEAPNVKKLCTPLLNARDENSRWQLKTIIENGYDLTVEEVEAKGKASHVMYKQHIMQCLKEKDYTTSIYSDLYRRLFKNNGICSRDITYVDACLAVEAIKADGGIAVLAHPGQLNSYDIIPELVLSGLDGIEQNHVDHGENDRKKIEKVCKMYGLLRTGGSDFHGKYGQDRITLGCELCPNETLTLM